MKGNWEIDIDATIKQSFSHLAESKHDGLRKHFVKKNMLLSINDSKIGVISGLKLVIVDYQLESSTDSQWNISFQQYGEQKQGTIQLLKDSNLKYTLGGDFDKFIWKSSQQSESALEERYLNKPEKDLLGRLPQELVKQHLLKRYDSVTVEEPIFVARSKSTWLVSARGFNKQSPKGVKNGEFLRLTNGKWQIVDRKNID